MSSLPVELTILLVLVFVSALVSLSIVVSILLAPFWLEESTTVVVREL